jgi:hypothetical protein
MGGIVILVVCDDDGRDGDGGRQYGRRCRRRPQKFQVLYVFRFGKYPSTDIFYDIRFDSRNIRRQIFQNEYFSTIYVIGLQRLQ